MRRILCLLAVAVTLGALSFGLASRARAHDRAIDYVRLTTPQRQVITDANGRVLWRDANRLGKTFALAFEAIHRARGTHPHKTTHRPPVDLILVSYSMEQMLPLMRMVWELAPRHELATKCGFDPGRGITGKPPRLVFAEGPGRGSVIHFATHKQGAGRLAGGEYQWAGLDEPTPESLYGEILPRLIRSRGHLMLTFTPVPDMPDQGWLRELVDAGQFSEHNYRLTEENCWIEGAPKPFMTASEIEEYAASLLSVERAMRIEGAWEPLITGRWLTNFGDHNIRAGLPPPGAELGIGIDHGAAAGKQAAVLVAVAGGRTASPQVWYLDEVTSDGYTTPAQDAEGIVAMLRRNGLQYHDIDEWVGDRPTGDNRFLINKTNKDLRQQLARILGLTIDRTKSIRTPKKWDGSVTYGLRMMNGLFGSEFDGAPAATVNPRCVRFIEFCRRFQGDRRDPLKDVGDAGRYITERLVQLPRANIGRVYA